MLYQVAIVDDHPEIIDQLKKELAGCAAIELVFTAHNGEDYLNRMKQLPPAGRPHLVIMDIEMPVMNGIEAVRIGGSLYPGVQYIMFTVNASDDKLFDAIKAGADGYLLKDEEPGAIFEAIKEVIDRSGAPMSPSIARKTLRLLAAGVKSKSTGAAVGATLSDREIEILKLMVSGLSYKQIADKIFLSPFTVRNHISKIYSKLHITTKAQAVKVAIDNKWV